MKFCREWKRLNKWITIWRNLQTSGFQKTFEVLQKSGTNSDEFSSIHRPSPRRYFILFSFFSFSFDKLEAWLWDINSGKRNNPRWQLHCQQVGYMQQVAKYWLLCRHHFNAHKHKVRLNNGKTALIMEQVTFFTLFKIVPNQISSRDSPLP